MTLRATREPAERRAHAGRLARGSAVGALLFLCVAGPHIVRSTTFLRDPVVASSPSHPAKWTYGLWGDWEERALNLVLGTYAHHSIGKDAAATLIRGLPVPWAGQEADLVTRRQAWAIHEDFAGNPLHLLVGLGLGLWLAATGRSLRPKAFWFALTPFQGWLVLHAFIRNQIWLSRLQTPVFVMLPLAWTAAADPGPPCARLRHAMLIGTSLLCLGVAYYDATHIVGKPVSPRLLGNYTRDELYYLYCPGGLAIKAEHDTVLAHLTATGGSRLGLVLGFDDCEYPLAWRAVRQGLEVRHCAAKSPWPDAVYVSTRATPAD